MSYCIVAQPRAWWPVTFPGVTEEGEVVENSFDMRFILHDEDEHNALMQAVGAVGGTIKEGDSFSTVAAPFIPRIATDWRGVLAENKEALKFEDEAIRLLVKQPGVWAAIWRAYAACRKAEPDIRAGN